MNEVDVHAINRGHKLRQCIKARLELPPVIVRLPVAREFLDCRELHAL